MHRQRVEENANVSFFWDRQSGAHWSCYVLLLTDFGQSRLSGLSLGSFINSTRWVRSCVPAVRQLVTKKPVW